MVAGTKRFVIFPPSDIVNLYPNPTNQKHFSQVDLDHPDLEKFPLLSLAKPTGNLMQVTNSDIA
jgi:hypothetical protein